MKKLLFISNIAGNVGIDNFALASLLAAKQSGFEFHTAINYRSVKEEVRNREEKVYSIKLHHIDFIRNPFAVGNIKAYKQTLDVIKNQEIEYIHCNTPIGGIIGRLVGTNKHIQKVIYQVHGFHFYKGAPFINWILFFPVEKILARITDAIITINKEDFELAKKHFHPRSQIYYVPGVGIELDQWKSEDSQNLREIMGLQTDDFVVLVVGRLEKNKNCRTVISAISKIANEKIKVVFCGDGKDRQELQEKANALGISDRVIFLGKRQDMNNVYHMADCFVLASFREGLSRSIMEAMACGLPCIVSDIRGNRDLIDEKGGFLFRPTDVDKLSCKITELFDSKWKRLQFGSYNRKKITNFSFEKVVQELEVIYKSTFV